LKELHLAGTKITDRSAQPLIHTLILKTKLEILNLENNTGIGFKTGNLILNTLNSFKET